MSQRAYKMEIYAYEYTDVLRYKYWKNIFHSSYFNIDVYTCISATNIN